MPRWLRLLKRSKGERMELFDYLKILDELGYGDKTKVEFEEYWNEKNMTGLMEILEYAVETAERLGIKLNLDEDEDKDSLDEDDDFDFDDGPELNKDGLFKRKGEYILGVKGAYDSKLRRVPLIEHQGRAYENFHGTCGLCSTGNAIRLLKIKQVTEKEMIDVAVENGWCIYDENGDPGHNGGTYAEMRMNLAMSYGIDPLPYNEFVIENAIEALKNGASVTYAVHAQFLSDGVPKRLAQKKSANHCITLVEVVYDTDGKTVKGVNVEDTGGWVGTPNGFKFIPIETFNAMKKATEYSSGIANFKIKEED